MTANDLRRGMWLKVEGRFRKVTMVSLLGDVVSVTFNKASIRLAINDQVTVKV